MTHSTGDNPPVRFEGMGPGPWRFDAFDLVAITALINLVQIAHDAFYLAVVLVASVCAGLWRRVRRSGWFWIALAAIWTPRLVFYWEHNEDHVYLGIYWCLAIGLAMLGGSAPDILARNARWLIGLAFAWACIWKCTSPDFVGGSLFHYKLLFDFRFREGITMPLAGLASEMAAANVAAIRELRDAGSGLSHVSLQFPVAVSWLAQVMTWWTLFIEGILAILFIFPTMRLSQRFRDVSLLFFALTTYLIVPVLGFGCLFMSLGIAQCDPGRMSMRWAYFVTSLVLMATLNVF